jgi:hypothetical protein
MTIWGHPPARLVTLTLSERIESRLKKFIYRLVDLF